MRGASLVTLLENAGYRVLIGSKDLPDESQLATRLQAFANAREFEVEIIKAKPGKRPEVIRRDLKRSIVELRNPGEQEGVREFRMTVSLAENCYVNPVVALEKILDVPVRECATAYRTGFDYLAAGFAVDSPAVAAHS